MKLVNLKGIFPDNLFVTTRNIEGFEVPIVKSNIDETIYPVLINDSGIIKAVFEQKMSNNENGSISYYHLAKKIAVGANTI